MIAKIIPSKRLPLSLRQLDYQIPKELQSKIKLGQLVKIPFRNQEIFGVVKEIVIKNSLKIKGEIKPITEIVLTQPVLNSQQLDFLQDMSEFYQVSLGWLLKTNLLPLQKKKLANLEIKSLLNRTNEPLLAPRGEVSGLTAFGLPLRGKPRGILSALARKNNPPTGGCFSLASLDNKSKFGKPRLIIYQNNQARLEYITKNIAGRGQNLILAPELIASQAFKLPDKLAERIIVITSELSHRVLFDRWLQILSGQKNIIIGTRRAIFLPWSNLKNIFLDDEANPSYKSWDMAPRFQTRDAALFLAKHHGAKLHLLTHTPSVESYYFAKHKVYLSSKQLVTKLTNQPMVVDMRDERKKKNYGFISDELVEQIKKVKTGDIFFFLNRRGSASYVGCRDCGHVQRCLNCHNLLTYHQDKSSLNCHYCQTTQPMIKTCSNCQGVNMVMYGVGTQLAESEIRKLLGSQNTKPVIRVDSDLEIKECLIKQLRMDHDKIIIGTQLVWPQIDWCRIRLLVFLDADTSLFVPEYKVSESLWYCLREASYRLNPEAKFLLQTNHPDHMTFACLSQPAKFYEQELAERRLFGYPPYKFLLKLFYGHQNQAVAETEAAKVMASFLNLTKTRPSIKLVGPIESVPYFNKGKYWQVLLVKINYSSYKQDTKFLLAKLPTGWKVDPNPNSVLSLT